MSNRVFQYFMVGTTGVLAAMGAKATVQGKSDTTIVVARVENVNAA